MIRISLLAIALFASLFIAGQCQSTEKAVCTLSFASSTMPLTGGKGISVKYDCSKATEKLYIKCDILDAAYTWYGYNDGDPTEISGAGKLDFNIVLQTPLVAGTVYQASTFIVSQAKYNSMEKTADAYKYCVNGEWPVSANITIGSGTTTPTDPCASSPCKNGGSCSGTSSFTCVCTSEYSGTTCLTKKPVVVADPCSPSPCSSDATCTKSSAATPTAICKCNSGFTGDGYDCTAIPVVEDPVNMCATKNGGCVTGATCSVSGSNVVSCKCPSSKPVGDGKTSCAACSAGTTYSATTKKCVATTTDPDPTAEGSTDNSNASSGNGNTTLIVIIIVIAVLAIAAGAFLWYRSRQQDSQKYAMQFMTDKNTTNTTGYSTNPYPPAPPAARPPPPAGAPHAPQYGRPY